MLILYAYKTELNPNNAQRQMFIRCCGASRWCYNWGLAAMKEAYGGNRKTSVYAEKKRLNAEKDVVAPWLREVPYVVLQDAFERLKTAYENFYRRVKQGVKGKAVGFPDFKTRRKGLGSFNMRGNLHVTETHIKLPIIGWVRIYEHGYMPTEKAVELCSVTISERAGHWDASLLVKEERGEPAPATGDVIGVDFGIKTLATVSDGRVYENPKALRKAQAGLKRTQREISRRVKGSANRRKSVLKLARTHRRVANIRKWTLNQISHDLVKNKPTVIVIEDLNVRGMLANHCLAQAISDVGFAELRRQIEYKAAWAGVMVLYADTWYPSSKTCSECGHVKPDLTLADREFICTECGVVLDRDLNAAMNLKKLVA